jgi:hypothetical protein
MKSSKGPVPVQSAAKAAIKAGIAKMAEMKKRKAVPEKLIEEEKGKPAPKKSFVTEKEMLSESSPVFGRGAATERMTGKTDRPASRNVYAEKEFTPVASKSQLVKEGFFVEDKAGDLQPTAKYLQYKKEGKLKGKYDIS